MKSANGLQGVYIESAKTMDPGDPVAPYRSPGIHRILPRVVPTLNLSLGGSLPWSREAYAFP